MHPNKLCFFAFQTEGSHMCHITTMVPEYQVPTTNACPSVVGILLSNDLATPPTCA